MLVKKGGVNIETKELKITASDVYDDGFLRVEHKNFYATWKGEMLRLTRAEFLIVSRLVRTRERFVSPEELWEVIWGTRKKYNAMSIRVYMYRLRNLFEPFGMEIDNLPSVGYRFVPHAKSQ